MQPKKEEMPVSPLVLGLFLFLVIGSAIVGILNNAERNDAMMEEMNK
jgi:Ribosome associated membrane protein RAMP4